MDKDVAIIVYDQAHFTIDADVRKVWARIGSNPIVYKNGSHKGINVSGFYSDKKFYAYRMKMQVKEEVLLSIKLLRMRFPKILLLLDKATWNKNSYVIEYLDYTGIDYMFFPTGASDLNPVEECWRQTRDNVTANTSYNSEEELWTSLENYWENQPFRHDVLNYLSS